MIVMSSEVETARDETLRLAPRGFLDFRSE